METKRWTEQQRQVVHSISDAVKCAQTKGVIEHFVLEAVAGSGKSSTLVEVVETVLRWHPRSRSMPCHAMLRVREPAFSCCNSTKKPANR